MKTIIAFTGVKQAGKTTSFNIVREIYPDAIEVTIAAKLKDVCAQVFEIPRDHFDNQDVKEKEMATTVYLNQQKIEAVIRGFGYEPNYDAHVRKHIGMTLHTPRQVAQYIGTEVLRVVDTNIHCATVIRNLPEDGLFVVTDMRFPNEFSFFKNHEPENFYPFYISNRSAEAALGPNSHSSETMVLEIAKNCTPIDNNGSLGDLRNNLVSAVATLVESPLAVAK